MPDGRAADGTSLVKGFLFERDAGDENLFANVVNGYIERQNLSVRMTNRSFTSPLPNLQRRPERRRPGEKLLVKVRAGALPTG